MFLSGFFFFHGYRIKEKECRQEHTFLDPTLWNLKWDLEKRKAPNYVMGEATTGVGTGDQNTRLIELQTS